MKQNFNIDQGASFQISLIWKTQDGNPVVLTGWDSKMQIRTSADSPDVILELSVTNGRITLDVLTGTIALYIADEDTASILKGIYVYDILMTSPSGDRTRLIEGTISVIQGVTRG